MAMNKVQFQPGLSMLEFFELYGTLERCQEVVRRWRWPEGFVCPACSATEHSKFGRGVAACISSVAPAATSPA